MNKISYVKNKIYSGIVKHTRFSPFNHSFSYKISYFWFRLNDFREYLLFKRNRITMTTKNQLVNTLTSIHMLDRKTRKKYFRKINA